MVFYDYFYASDLVRHTKRCLQCVGCIWFALWWSNRSFGDFLCNLPLMLKNEYYDTQKGCKLQFHGSTKLSHLSYTYMDCFWYDLCITTLNISDIKKERSFIIVVVLSKTPQFGTKMEPLEFWNVLHWVDWFTYVLGQSIDTIRNIITYTGSPEMYIYLYFVLRH